jgi:cation-transporting P-type ATPase C
MERFRQEQRVSLESFLGGTAVAAVAVGEAGTALEVLWIHSGAGLLTSWITERSRQAVSEIMRIGDSQAFTLVDGVEIAAAVDSLTVGELVAVHADERISVDGQVEGGSALVDESPINGRAEFALRQAGDSVFAGTIVREGWLHIRAERVWKATYLARIFQMVEESLENKAPIEGVADQLARTLVNLGFVATAGTLLLTGSLWNAFTVMLVMACPCATALAASTAVSAAINRAARRHILIKGGRYLEEIGKAEVVCFDKTGTLTTGSASLQALVSMGDSTDATLLEGAAAAEGHSRHPLALALVAHARAHGLTLVPPDLSEAFLGMGVRAVWNGDESEIVVGNHKLMDRFYVPMGAAHGAFDSLLADQTVVYVAKNGKLLGWLVFSQQLRTDAHTVVAQLRETGVTQTVLVTGDEKPVAQALATNLGLDLCHASVLPEEKARLVAEFGGNGRVVVMVGDGVNDALALAKADVGVAMGAGGSAVAIEAADIALVRDDLRDLVFVRSLSQQTLRVVHQNFWIATGSNVIGVLLGATGRLSPLAAGLLHIVHTLGVLANSSRLLRYESHEDEPIAARAFQATAPMAANPGTRGAGESGCGERDASPASDGRRKQCTPPAR